MRVLRTVLTRLDQATAKEAQQDHHQHPVHRLAGLTMAEDTTRLLTAAATLVKPTATTRMDIIRIGKPQTATVRTNDGCFWNGVHATSREIFQFSIRNLSRYCWRNGQYSTDTRAKCSAKAS